MNMYSKVALIHFIVTLCSASLFEAISNGIDGSFSFLTYGSRNALSMYFDSFGGLVVGAVVASILSSTLVPMTSRSDDFAMKFNPSRFDRAAIVFLLAGLIVLFGLFWVGGAGLWSRNNYSLDVRPDSLWALLINSLEQPLGLVPVIVRFVLIRNRGYLNSLNFLYFCIVVIYLFAVGTKFASVVVALYFFAGDFRTGRFARDSIFGVVLGVVVFLLVMGQRLDGTYGVLSLVGTVPNIVDHAKESFLFSLSVVSSPVYIAAETYYAIEPNWTDLVTELSPLGGVASGWYEISDFMRINYAIPYSGVGTLWAFGFFAMLLYGVFCSITFGWLERLFLNVFGPESRIFVVVISLVQVSIFTQYNLRSATRWIYYGMALCLMVYILRLALFRIRYSVGVV